MLPEKIKPALQTHLEKVFRIHQCDISAGFGRVSLPHALCRKYPNASVEWGWHYLFSTGEPMGESPNGCAGAASC